MLFVSIMCISIQCEIKKSDEIIAKLIKLINEIVVQSLTAIPFLFLSTKTLITLSKPLHNLIMLFCFTALGWFYESESN